ncbi:MAG: GlsB/YeaQ/YmgE family stress response membrane protein [Acidobacteriota bacterium]|nr:GlsB/YeaQ/YmgE family stress response membrane protein [Acidobacteriota bacterium]
MTSIAGLALAQSHAVFVGVSSRGLIAWVIIGLLAGWIAGVITRGRGFGCLVNIILGLIGAVIGGWIFTRLGIPAWGFWASLAAATVGAVVLVAIGRLFAGRSSD